MQPGTIVAIAIYESREMDDLMKVDMSFLAVFLLIGTNLLARAAVQGVEPALVSTAIEYGSAGLNLLSRWVRRCRFSIS
jgi:hypothetical protein